LDIITKAFLRLIEMGEKPPFQLWLSALRVELATGTSLARPRLF
jgi:hypothetical protein